MNKNNGVRDVLRPTGRYMGFPAGKTISGSAEQKDIKS